MTFKVRDHIYVDWPNFVLNGPEFNRTYGYIFTAGQLGIPQADKDELWVKWTRGTNNGCVQLALLEADARLNGTEVRKIVRTYTRPYVGRLRRDINAQEINDKLLAQGKDGLVRGSPTYYQVHSPTKERENSWFLLYQIFRITKAEQKDYFQYFDAIMGPFKTMRAARFAERNGIHNCPDFKTVGEYEEFAKQIMR